MNPASLEEVQEHIHRALTSGEALEIVGGGSKRRFGHPVRAHRILHMAGLKGVVDYQPHELILVARPGTPLVELEPILAEAGQMLAFEPPHWGPGATLGGTLACNLSGPRRFKAGAARDHLLGFQAVTGSGDVVRGGGRVVKNVTGYDLSKLMCGSFGTLAVMTEVVLKVLPAAETERTVLLAGLNDAAGLERLRAAARSSHEPSGLAHLPAGLTLTAAAAQVAGGAPPKGNLASGDSARGSASLTAIRLEGPEPSVKARSGALANGGAILDEGDSRAFWAALRELEPLPLTDGERLWRFSLPPSAASGLGVALGEFGPGRLYYDWGGGLVWAALSAKAKPGALHKLAKNAGGHAQLVREGGASAVEGPVFSELTPGQHRLHVNLKAAFDPKHILNPGRLYPDL